MRFALVAVAATNWSLNNPDRLLLVDEARELVAVVAGFLDEQAGRQLYIFGSAFSR